MGTWTKEKVESLLNEKTFDEHVTEEGLTKQQIVEVRENIWYKLYLLQNYKVTMDMFLGSTVRWRSIQLYQSVIRSIYKGKVDEYTTSSVYSPSLIKYIKGLMDSGMEPYPVLENEEKRNLTSIQQLLNYDVLTPNEAKYIYESVGPKDNLPDTTISGYRNVEFHRQHHGTDFERYSQLTKYEEDNITNPINIQKSQKTPPKLFQPVLSQVGISLLDLFKVPFTQK